MKAELKPLKGEGRTWENFYHALWVIATVRYVTRQQLKTAFPKAVWCNKCVSPKILSGLAEKGFLSITEEEVLTATPKAIELLRSFSGYNTDIIRPAEGKGEGDALQKAEVFLRLLKLPDFYALFYPEFRKTPRDDQPFLVPDAALVLKRENKARLIFLEVERKKSNWQAHLEGKRQKYEVLAQDIMTWSEWWRSWCELLKLRVCPAEEFGFSVWCIGEPKYGWEGWRFSELDEFELSLRT